MTKYRQRYIRELAGMFADTNGVPSGVSELARGVLDLLAENERLSAWKDAAETTVNAVAMRTIDEVHKRLDVQFEPATETLEAAFLKDDFGGSPDRPYNGQPWTALGKRGEQPVVGLTMRDIGDCFARGAAQARDEIRTASIQNALLEIEKMMDIYPNIDEEELIKIPVITVNLNDCD